MNKYIFAEPVKIDGHLAVRYVDTEGKERIRVGGTAAFRNNNPGNLMYLKDVAKWGAIAKGLDNFAIFPDWETGDKAMQILLRRGIYRNMSIRQTLEKYAPPKYNNTEAYITDVTRSTGLPETKRIGDMTDGEFQRFRDAMKKHEDSTPGHDLIDQGPEGHKQWYRVDYLKIKRDSSPKDFSGYGPDIPIKHQAPVEFQPIPQKNGSNAAARKTDNAKPAAKTGAAQSAAPQKKAHSNVQVPGGETLERHGAQVTRIEKSGSSRGTFYSP